LGAPGPRRMPRCRAERGAPSRSERTLYDHWPPILSGLAHLALLGIRSEEHTSELQSLTNLVCRLLLEKKNTEYEYRHIHHTTRSALPSSHVLFLFSF